LIDPRILPSDIADMRRVTILLRQLPRCKYTVNQRDCIRAG